MLTERLVQVHSHLGPEVLLFQALQGREGLSQPFELQVDVVCNTPLLDLRSLLGESLSLEIRTPLAVPRFLDGRISAFRLLGKTGRSDRFYTYRATLRPWLWFLSQNMDSRIFQEKTVPEVLQDVLGRYPFAWESRLTEDYPRQTYCVQYQESDFQFVSRLMEREGIYYWFEHRNGAHTLVMADDAGQHAAAPWLTELPFVSPDRVAHPDVEHIHAWHPYEQVTPGRYATADYDYCKPGASLDATRSNPAEHALGDLEVYEWAGGYTEPHHGEHYSRLRLEALQAVRSQAQAQTNARGVAPGYVLSVRNHPRLEDNRDYLVTQVDYDFLDVSHTGESGMASHYFIDFRVMPSSQPYRPLRLTPVPRTYGPQTAKVVGKSGEQLWTDQYGRIKVQFLWDRYGQANENSSCWLRVSSPWAGGGFGGIQLPRVGDEVIVDFLGGDPDRPIAVGRVYNASNMPPWNLPDNATQSGFLSRSKDGDPSNANAFMFEDRAGQERIWLHAERNLDTEVEGDETHTVDGNRTTVITGHDTLSVMATRTTTVQDLETETFNSGVVRTVIGDLVETIEGEQTRTHTGDVTRTVTGNVTDTLTGDLSRTITGDVTHTVTGEVTDAITGTRNSTQTGDYTRTITGAVDYTVTGDVKETVTGNVDLTTTGNVTDTLTGNLTKSISGPVDITASTGVNITTPSWKVNVTSLERFWVPHTERVTGFRLNGTGASLDAWGMRAQAYGLNYQWAYYKIDKATFKNDEVMLDIKKKGLALKKIGMETHKSMMSLRKAILHLFM